MLLSCTCVYLSDGNSKTKVISWKEFQSLGFVIARVYSWPWVTFLFPFCTQVSGTAFPSLSQSNAGHKCTLATKPWWALPALQGPWESSAPRWSLAFISPQVLGEEWKSKVAFQMPESPVVHLPYSKAVVCSLGSFGPTVSLCNYTILMHTREDKPLGTNSSKYLEHVELKVIFSGVKWDGASPAWAQIDPTFVMMVSLVSYQLSQHNFLIISEIMHRMRGDSVWPFQTCCILISPMLRNNTEKNPTGNIIFV